jgi:hypothetical protein
MDLSYSWNKLEQIRLSIESPKRSKSTLPNSEKETKMKKRMLYALLIAILLLIFGILTVRAMTLPLINVYLPVIQKDYGLYPTRPPYITSTPTTILEIK